MIGHGDVGLQIAPFGHGGAEVADVIHPADGQRHLLLYAVPLDVVHTGGDPGAVAEIVLRTDFVVLDRVRTVRRGRVGQSEIVEIGQADGTGDGRIGAATAKTG